MVANRLARLSLSDLHREIRRRQRGVKVLHRRRAKVMAKLGAQIMARDRTIASQAGLRPAVRPASDPRTTRT